MITLSSQIESCRPLLVAALLSGMIGYERELKGRAAGFRTHILVGVGSCLVMVTSHVVQGGMATNDMIRLDPTRLGAGVLAGIGFLGAGTIMRSNTSVKGLTTAATLWLAACIGLAVGGDFLVGAVVTTALSLLCLGISTKTKKK